MRISLKRTFHVAATCLVMSLLAACASDAEQTKPDETLQQLGTNLRIAKVALDNRDAQTAKAVYTKASELAPNDPRPWIGLGKTALSVRDTDTAIRMFTKGISVGPKSIEAHIGLGQALLKSGQLKHAEKAFAEATNLPDTTATAYNGWGISLDALGRHSEAQQAYDIGTQKFPASLALRNNQAFSLAMSGDYESAIKALTPLADTPTARKQIKLNLALLHGLAGNADQAKYWGSQVLTTEEVKKNLGFYESLRGLPAKVRTQILLDMATD